MCRRCCAGRGGCRAGRPERGGPPETGTEPPTEQVPATAGDECLVLTRQLRRRGTVVLSVFALLWAFTGASGMGAATYVVPLTLKAAAVLVTVAAILARLYDQRRYRWPGAPLSVVAAAGFVDRRRLYDRGGTGGRAP